MLFSDMEIILNVNNSAMENLEFTSTTIISFRNNSSKIFDLDILNSKLSACKIHYSIKVSLWRMIYKNQIKSQKNHFVYCYNVH